MKETSTTVCVYGASREDIDNQYKEAAYNLGQMVGRKGWTLVSGGGRAGLMRCVIDGATSVGGKTIGVLPKFMDDRQWAHPQLTITEVTPDMHSRKERMAQLADACVALPGGCGTFEELLEIITWRKLHLFGGKVIILNTKGYYTPLVDMLTRAIDEGFMKPEDHELWKIVDTPEEAIDYINQ